MLINNLRQLQTIVENSNDEYNVINHIISDLKQAKIDVVIADKKGNSIYNTKIDPQTYFYKIPLVAMNREYRILYVNGIDSLEQNELAFFYSAIPILSMALRSIYIKSESKIKNMLMSAKVVIGSFSQLEIKALKFVFEELNFSDGVIVISKISDKYKITRSVIVNALKKSESAGIINIISMGMKGTKISINNKYFLSEIKDC